MTISSTDEMDRRQSFRLDMEKELIDIIWQNEAGIEQTKKIACLDFARGGLKIDCDIAIAVTTPIKVVFKGAKPRHQTLSGKVLRCIKQTNGWYEIALTLETTSK